MTDIHLEIGAIPGQMVAIKLGPLVIKVNPSTARAYAIGLIHAAEVAGMPPEPPKPESKLVGLNGSKLIV